MFKTKRDAALFMASKGLKVFPLRPDGRLPVFKGWQDAATTDREIITRYWTTYPDHNVGIMTGDYESKSLVVLDVDTKKGKDGLNSFKKLDMLYGPIPKTFLVKTPSGGFHAYFFNPYPLAGSVERLGAGLDIRAQGNLVVAPGSTIDGVPYTIVDDLPIADLPTPIAELCEVPLRKAEYQQAIDEVDTQDIIDRALSYLKNTAPEAIEGAGGDQTTFRVAAKLKDLGLSESKALELLLSSWNETKALPPWSPEALERKVANAYAYGKNAIGSANPQAAFDPVPEPPDMDGLLPPVVPFDVKSIPRRSWIYGSYLLKGKVTELIAPPGTGKSTFTIGVALSIASGKDIFGVPVKQRAKVALWNNEDDRDELNRRLSAMMVHHNLDFSDLSCPDPQLFMQSGEVRMFTAAQRADNAIVPKDAAIFTDWLIKNKIGVAIIDPFSETHAAKENDNVEMLKVVQIYRKIAQDANCAVMLVHHTRKPPNADPSAFVGNMDSGRGASSITGAARIVLTLHGMSKKDAQDLGVPENERRRFVRLDDAKANLSLLSDKAKWFKRVSVPLPTYDIDGTSDTFPDTETGRNVCFEEVGALEPVKLLTVKETDAGFAAEARGELLDDVTAIMENRPRETFRTLMKDLRRLGRYNDLGARELGNMIEETLKNSPDFTVYTDRDVMGRNYRMLVKKGLDAKALEL